MPNNRINYYFDMDGVTAIYERNAYPPLSEIYKQPGSHYYKKVKPDEKMIKVIKILYENQMQNPDDTNSKSKYHLGILSTLTPRGDIYMEQAGDKTEWIHKHMSFAKIPSPRFSIHFAGSNKNYIGEALSPDNKLRRTDILIDDYNKNLKAWEEMGGTAVKYCNGLNHAESWGGFCITRDMEVDDIVEFLEQIANSYKIADWYSILA